MKHFLPCCGECCDCSSVKRILKRNNVIAVFTLCFHAIFSCDFDSTFIGFCTRITKEKFGLSNIKV